MSEMKARFLHEEMTVPSKAKKTFQSMCEKKICFGVSQVTEKANMVK